MYVHMCVFIYIYILYFRKALEALGTLELRCGFKGVPIILFLGLLAGAWAFMYIYICVYVYIYIYKVFSLFSRDLDMYVHISLHYGL